MRLYLSKKEAEIIRGLLIDEILTTFNFAVNTNIHERLLNRIEDCLQKQKSGYNGGKKQHDKD